MDTSSPTPWSIWFYIFLSSSWPASDHYYVSVMTLRLVRHDLAAKLGKTADLSRHQIGRVGISVIYTEEHFKKIVWFKVYSQSLLIKFLSKVY